MLGPAYYFGFGNLVPVDFGTFVVLLVMAVIAMPVMLLTWREVMRTPDPTARVEVGNDASSISQ